MFITIALHLFLMNSIHAINHSDASVARKHNISARRIIQSDLKPEMSTCSGKNEYGTINVNDDLHKDLSPTCSGFGMCETCVNIAQNCINTTRRTGTYSNGTCSFIVGYTDGLVQIRMPAEINPIQNKNENFSDETKKTFSMYEAYSNNWKELTRTLIAILGPDFAYMLFCVVFIVANVLGMFTIPWMVLASHGYRYTLHLNLVGMKKVRRKKDSKVVYGTTGRIRFSVDVLRGRFGLLVMMNSLVSTQAYEQMPDGCNHRIGKWWEDRLCYPRKAVDDWIAGGTLKENVIKTYGLIQNWDMSLVTDLSNLFYKKYTLNADLSNWNVSQVTNMAYGK